jgi:hypothetical protein
VVSQNIEAQYITTSWWNYPHKGVLLNDVSGQTETASITYTRLMGLQKALDIELNMDAGDQVKHCVFERCLTALFVAGAEGRSISVSNCLFHYSQRGNVTEFNYSAASVEYRNCTFDRNESHMDLKEGASGESLVITDCLFSNADVGIGIWNGAVTDFTQEHNAFYKCGDDGYKRIWLYYAQQEGSVDPSSKRLDDTPYDPNWFDEDDPASADWAEQWYLDQSGACVNGGSRTAYAANLATRTTRLADADYDYGPVDIGYHYPTGLDVSKTHFDNEASSAAGETDVFYDYGGTVSNRLIRIYNADGELVYEYAPSGEGTTIGLEGWDGTGNQGGYNGQDLDTGAYMVVVIGDGDEYTRCHVYIEQDRDSSLEIQRPDDDETVDWL